MSETILYNFAPSTYWQEYVKTYWHLRTMQVMHEWSKEATYYKNLERNPYDLSLPKKDHSTLPSPTAAKLNLKTSKKDKRVAKENYPPTDSRRRINKRTVFSQKQLRKLTRVFKTSKYISGKQRHSLAQQLGVSGTVVNNWFHNQRAKLTRLLSK
ncbi:hypothetical protein J6590_088736 [Homalodisca vitripennis]|nr:hypothetical protein J6590_088736 [Homalodisca vitripennis]